MKVYFDNAATTPVEPRVADVMTKILREEYGNPSSTHSHGRITKTWIEESRRKMANLLGCVPGELFFTSGGTEADNMAIRKSVDDLGVKNIISSPIEHHAVLHTIEELHHQGKVVMHLVNLDKQGHIDLTHLEELLSTHTNVLVSLMHANNELGTMIDLVAVGNLCRKYNAFFHSDTVQTIGHIPINLAELNVDFITGSAHKFNGPKGVGFLYINSRVQIHPMLTGGAQERNMRGGTENLYGIAGMATALEIACEELEKEREHITGLKNYMMESLKNAIPGVQFNGDTGENSLYTVLNVNFPPTPIAEMILFKLDISGISASGGSACSSGSNVGSHVLAAIGVPSDRPSVRFSFGKQNTREEVDFVVGKLTEMLTSQPVTTH